MAGNWQSKMIPEWLGQCEDKTTEDLLADPLRIGMSTTRPNHPLPNHLPSHSLIHPRTYSLRASVIL